MRIIVQLTGYLIFFERQNLSFSETSATRSAISQKQTLLNSGFELYELALFAVGLEGCDRPLLKDPSLVKDLAETICDRA